MVEGRADPASTITKLNSCGFQLPAGFVRSWPRDIVRLLAFQLQLRSTIRAFFLNAQVMPIFCEPFVQLLLGLERAAASELVAVKLRHHFHEGLACFWAVPSLVPGSLVLTAHHVRKMLKFCFGALAPVNCNQHVFV